MDNKDDQSEVAGIEGNDNLHGFPQRILIDLEDLPPPITHWIDIEIKKHQKSIKVHQESIQILKKQKDILLEKERIDKELRNTMDVIKTACAQW